jgi:hypothetical protein
MKKCYVTLCFFVILKFKSLAPWIEISVKNRLIFVKTGKTGLHRLIKNRSVKFEIKNSKKESILIFLAKTELKNLK